MKQMFVGKIIVHKFSRWKKHNKAEKQLDMQAFLQILTSFLCFSRILSYPISVLRERL